MLRFLAFISLVAIVALAITSCEPKPVVNYQVLAEDTNDAQKLFDDLFKVLDEEAKNGDFSDTLNGKTTVVRSAVSDTCAVVTLDLSGGFPMTLTVDFGNNCTAQNTVTGGSLTRSGIVQAVFSGPYNQQGSTVTISTNNYFVNNHQVEGTTVITNAGRNSSNNLEFMVNTGNGVITKPDGGNITWVSERTHEWISGENTNLFTDGIAGICDDVYLLYGYGEGEVSDGTEYRIEATEPLRKEICCRWVTDGLLTYYVNGDELGSLDYDQTTCLNPSAVLNYGDQSIVVVIQ